MGKNGTPGCAVCRRDNDNSTHAALERAGHLSHEYITPGEVETWSAAQRAVHRAHLLLNRIDVWEDGPLGAAAIAKRQRAEDSGPDYDTGAQEEPPEPQRSTPLTFAEFSRVNASRASRWHPGFPEEDSWSIADWSNALAGEGGELADATMDVLVMLTAVSGSIGQLANTIKKLRRIETAHFSQRADEQDHAVLVHKALGEAADVFTYLDLLVTKLGGRMDEAAADKFNSISEREGLPERMPTGVEA